MKTKTSLLIYAVAAATATLLVWSPEIIDWYNLVFTDKLPLTLR